MHLFLAKSEREGLAALPGEVGIQLFLHLVGNLALDRADDGVGHLIGEQPDEVDVRHHLRAAHDSRRVIPVVGGCGVGRCDAGEGNGGHTGIGEGGGVAGIDVLTGLDADAVHQGQIADEVGQTFLGGRYRAETAHDGTNHIYIDVQHDILQLLCVRCNVGFGAQQAALLAATPDKAETVTMGVVFIISGQ